MTGVDHEHTAAVDQAEEWLVSTPDHLKPHPILVHLRAQFGLSTREAVDCIRAANQRRNQR